MESITTGSETASPQRKPLKLRSREQAAPLNVKPPATLLKTWLSLLESDDNHVRENATRNIFRYYESLDAAKADVSGSVK